MYITMANARPSTQRRRPGRKAEDIRLVWKEQAPEAVFAGKTLAELEASLVELQQSNEDLKIRDQARSAAVKTRDDKLKSLTSLLRVVVKGVREDRPVVTLETVCTNERGERVVEGEAVVLVPKV